MMTVEEKSIDVITERAEALIKQALGFFKKRRKGIVFDIRYLESLHVRLNNFTDSTDFLRLPVEIQSKVKHQKAEVKVVLEAMNKKNNQKKVA